MLVELNEQKTLKILIPQIFVFFIFFTYLNGLFSEIVIGDLEHEIMFFGGSDTLHCKNYALRGNHTCLPLMYDVKTI